MNQLRKFRKNKEETKKKVNRVKSTTLKLALIMLNFIFATFAWFTYTIILDTTVDVNVSAWQVDFKDNENILGTSMEFQVGIFYPGMEDFVKDLQIVNLGDRAASITYQIDELKILGQEYQIKETQEEGDSEYTVYKSETVENGMKVIKLLNDQSKYPFEITLTHTPEIYVEDPNDADQNKGTFEIRFTWPYVITENEVEDEQRNELDTLWGYNIANFYNARAEGDTTQGIEMTLKVVAKQIID